MTHEPATRLTARAAYGRLWRNWLRPHWPILIVAVILMAIVAVTSAGYAAFMERVVDAMEDPASGVIWWGPLGIVALTSSKGVSHYLQQVVQNRVLAQVQADMQRRMFDRLVHMDLAQLLAEAPAALAARFSADIELVRLGAQHVFGSIRDLLTLTAVIIYMLTLDALMAAGLILVFALAFGPIGLAGAKVRRIANQTQAEIAGMTDAVNEGLSGIRMVRTYQLEDWLSESSSGIFESLRRLRVRLVAWQALVTPMIEVLAGLAIAVLLFLVTWRIGTGAIDLAGFIGLITALGVATNPARKLGGAYAIGLQGMAALERVYALFDAENAIEDGTGEFADGERPKGDITFEGVDFVYPDGYQALHSINLQIDAGKTFAFVGRSGAGKSTVFNLLPRLFDASAGAILIDGRNTRDLTLRSLREQISVVGQDAVLLSGTIRDNIRFGRKGALAADVEAAAKAAAAHDFIMELPHGYDTLIDPSKAAFSGGERQRLSIARAILRDAPILLLDEPTSALDAASEAAIREALDRLSDGRTTLVIAHRLATILDADQIVVMDQGRIVDQGTHDELLEHGGLYAELYNLQFDLSPSSGTGRGRKGSALEPRNRGVLERISRFFSFGGADSV